MTKELVYQGAFKALGLVREAGYMYFINKEGDIERSKLGRKKADEL